MGLSLDAARVAGKRLPMLPQRQHIPGPRNGQHLDSVARRVGDSFYRCAIEVAKVAYSKIDARYSYAARKADPKIDKRHQDMMDEARKILNEARNDVFEAVLPLFLVSLRKYGSEEAITEHDLVAHDFIVKNIFDMMTRTFKAWADQFVEEDQVSAFENSIDKVAVIQKERLEGWLLNFRFIAKTLSINK